MRLDIRIQAEPFDPGLEWQALTARLDGAAGAVATFIGLVRDRHEAVDVATLELEHYPGMTERSIEVIADNAAARWPLLDVLIIHRVGVLGPREPIVLVQVAAGHRPAAFAACEYLMDYLKTEAVFWKRERTEHGARWVNSTSDDQRRARAWQTAADRAAGAEE